MPSTLFRSDLRRYVQEVDKQARIEMRNGMREVGEEWLEYYRQVTQQWTNKPKFIVRVRVPTRGLMRLFVQPEGDNAAIWRYVDKGTEPHVIRPHGDYPLRFRGGYSARTKPIAKFGVGDGKAHGAWRASYQVNHPGNEARKFSDEAEKRVRPKFSRLINNAIRRGIRRVT